MKVEQARFKTRKIIEEKLELRESFPQGKLIAALAKAAGTISHNEKVFEVTPPAPKRSESSGHKMQVTQA